MKESYKETDNLKEDFVTINIFFEENGISTPVELRVDNEQYNKITKVLEKYHLKLTPKKIAGAIVFTLAAVGVGYAVKKKIETRRVYPELQGEKEREFEEIFDQYHQRILNYVRFHLPNSQDAEDVTSQVFESAYNTYGNFVPNPGYDENILRRAWLYKIAKSKISRYYRDQERSDRYLMSVDIDDPSVQNLFKVSSKDSGVDKEKYLNTLISAINSLEEDEKTLIFLKYFAGLPDKEIAYVLENTVGGIKSKHHRIKQWIIDYFVVSGDLSSNK